MSQQHTTTGSRHFAGLALVAVLLLAASSANAQWLSRPAPPMPTKVFREAYNGAVTVRVILNSDGSVRDARLMGSSGHGDLDDLALQTVMRWRLDPREVRPSDLTEGRGQIIGFKQGGPPPRELTPSAKAYWALVR